MSTSWATGIRKSPSTTTSNGWVADPYLLQAEFYMDPADYDVRVTVPHGLGGRRDGHARQRERGALARGARSARRRPPHRRRRARRRRRVRRHGGVRRRRLHRDMALHRARRERLLLGHERRVRLGRDARPGRRPGTCRDGHGEHLQLLSPARPPRPRGPWAALASRAMPSSSSRRTCGPIRGRR